MNVEDGPVDEYEEDATEECVGCGSTKTAEIGDETQTITVCGECGYDGP